MHPSAPVPMHGMRSNGPLRQRVEMNQPTWLEYAPCTQVPRYRCIKLVCVWSICTFGWKLPPGRTLTIMYGCGVQLDKDVDVGADLEMNLPVLLCPTSHKKPGNLGGLVTSLVSGPKKTPLQTMMSQDRMFVDRSSCARSPAPAVGECCQAERVTNETGQLHPTTPLCLKGHRWEGACRAEDSAESQEHDKLS